MLRPLAESLQKKKGLRAGARSAPVHACKFDL